MASTTYTFKQRRIIGAYRAGVEYVTLLNDMLALARKVRPEVGGGEVDRLVELIAEYEADGEELIDQAIMAGLEPEDLD